MERLVSILLLCAAALAQESPLEPVSFLVGEFEGTGEHQWGTYTETLTGEWQVNRTVLVVRTRSRMQGRVIYEDLRVFSWDDKRGRIRMRQYAMGDLAVYDVVVEKGRILFQETAHEGSVRAEWRYTIERDGDDAFRYRVDARGKDGFAKYVAGSLKRKVPPPSEQGKLEQRVTRARIGAMDAEIHHPAGDGPYPVVVFSPGGNAQTTQGYAPFGRWFASWGYATVIVAFNVRDPAERAALYSKVADWLDGDHPLQGKLDTTRLVACGHSLGGAAAILAARADKRFGACLALAPTGPAALPESGHEPATFVVVGDRDQFRETCGKVYAMVPKPRYLVTIEGMNHGFGPPAAGMKVLARATAFLNLRVKGDARYRDHLLRDADGVSVEVEE